MLRRLYDWTMAKAAHRHAAWWLAAFAFMEASFFPVPPHPLLGLMCLSEPKKALRFATVATLASVAGGILGYAIGFFLFESVGKPILEFFHLTKEMDSVRCMLAHNPWWVMLLFLLKAMTPIPFKLLTITAGFLQFPFGWFIFGSFLARSTIFIIVGVLFQRFGAPIKAVIDRHLGKVTAAFVILVVGGFLAITLLSGGGRETNEKCEAAAQAA